MKNEKPRKQPSRLYWISMTFNTCLIAFVAALYLGILQFNPARASQPQYAQQAQIMPAKLPLTQREKQAVEELALWQTAPGQGNSHD